MNEALRLASEQQTSIGGKKFRVYRAGTGTFIYTKKTGKQKNLEQAKYSLPRLPFPVVVPSQNSNDRSSFSPPPGSIPLLGMGPPPPVGLVPQNVPATIPQINQRAPRPMARGGRGRGGFRGFGGSNAVSNIANW